nr:MAG TPA: hypothetical protein [Caudoviricetes sp.]
MSLNDIIATGLRLVDIDYVTGSTHKTMKHAIICHSIHLLKEK